MKANKVKRLLRKAAKKNEFTIDEITGTGSGEVDVFGSDAYGNDILITAYRNRKGKIEELSYMNFGSSSQSLMIYMFLLKLTMRRNSLKDLAAL